MRGKFITLEGIDGAGKSTHLAWLAAWLQERGIAARITREPGGTELGEKLRQLILSGETGLHPETETLLMFAARREHLDKVIVPALNAGTWVVCDRFTDATFAYQAGGSGVAWDKIEALERWVQQGLQPDVTICLDLAPEIGRSRTKRIKAPDRFEREAGAFYLRVREGYLRRTREHSGRVYMLDASGSIPDIQKQIENIVVSKCF